MCCFIQKKTFPYQHEIKCVKIINEIIYTLFFSTKFLKSCMFYTYYHISIWINYIRNSQEPHCGQWLVTMLVSTALVHDPGLF